MDFIRASVKALFYDYPVDTALQVVTTGCPLLTDSFVKLVNARERCYSQASMDALKLKLKTEWIKRGPVNDGKEEILKVLELPLLYAKEVFDNKIDEPTIDFKNLFRWNELVKYVGEDLMAVNYLAHRDVEKKGKRGFFEWDAVLSHNEDELNKVLRSDSNGWCDIHMHLWATTDVFELNWINLMNHITDCKASFSMLTHPLDCPILVTKSYNYDNLYRWCILAALIRWELFKYYKSKKVCGFGDKFESEFSRLVHQVPMYYRYELRNLQSQITIASKDEGVFKTNEGHVFDYAIVKDSVDYKYTKSPFFIYHGERWLLYQFYYDYWQNKGDLLTISKYVYLYELIKVQLRREILQINDLPGLGNFQTYNSRKMAFLENRFKPLALRYAVQSSMIDANDGMEARISPLKDEAEYKKFLNVDYQKYLFDKGEFTTKGELEKRMTFVVHFLKKKNFKNNLHSEQRKYNKHQAELLIEKIWIKEEKKGLPHRIVGIDAAGGETHCRPEVFAHLYRYCRKKGMKNFTYHVGEDFYDVTEGLRSIEEAVRFLHLSEGNRLGHCIALGIDAHRYYEQRHRKVIMPKQLLLDNIVWLLWYCEKYHICLLGLKEKLENLIHKLYNEIGYAIPYDSKTYMNSMLLRGDELFNNREANNCWAQTANDNSPTVLNASVDDGAVSLWKQYFSDPEIYKKGFQTSEVFIIPHMYERIIKKVQNTMIKRLRDKNIYIETNPTSNLRIGRIGQYNELPLFRFSNIRKGQNNGMFITVNTDDKGIFGTSLHREFSLIALALVKQRRRGDVVKWGKGEIYRYVAQIASSGQKQRFR